MKNINIKGITSEAIAGILILLVALINAIFQMLGFNTLPIESEEISNIVSIVFLIVTTLWNTYKNRNISTAAQTAQQVTNAIKSGELLVEDVNALLEKCKMQKE